MDFADFETEIIKANGGLVGYTSEPNGDVPINLYALYARFTSA